MNKQKKSSPKKCYTAMPLPHPRFRTGGPLLDVDLGMSLDVDLEVV